MAYAPRWGQSTCGLPILLAAALGACDPGEPPVIEPIDDAVVSVGGELRWELHTSDPDGDPLELDFAADLPSLPRHATLTRAPGGTAIFRWSPLAADVGAWHVDFTASDGDHRTTATARVEVRPAVGDGSAPRFRAPLGAGTTLDLAAHPCLDLDVSIDDQDSTSVVIAEEEPRIPGASLTATGGLAARWHWCPDAAQLAAGDRYTLTLSASDLTNAPAIVHYLIVLRRPGERCPDDRFEQNDGRAQVATATPIAVGAFDAMSCPADDEDADTDDDWYRVVLSSRSIVSFELAGGDATDLDLDLYDATGTPRRSATAAGSSESLSACVDAGAHYVRVHGYGRGDNPYRLAYAWVYAPCTPSLAADSPL